MVFGQTVEESDDSWVIQIWRTVHHRLPEARKILTLRAGASAQGQRSDRQPQRGPCDHRGSAGSAFAYATISSFIVEICRLSRARSTRLLAAASASPARSNSAASFSTRSTRLDTTCKIAWVFSAYHA